MRLPPNAVIQQIIWKLKEPGVRGRPILIVPAATPGSGKSTFLKQLETRLYQEDDLIAAASEVGRSLTFVTASTDNIIEMYAHNNNLTYDQAYRAVSFKDVERQFKREIGEAIELKINLIVDRTNLSPKSRNKALGRVTADYFKIGVAFTLDERVRMERLASRKAEIGKSIPSDTLRDMNKTYVSPSRDEGFDFVIDVNTN